MVSKLDLYKVFSQVARSESFSKAAKTLYLTQPAVSQSILQLEDELAIRLFNRTPRGVTLTKEGLLLYDYVNSAMNLLDAGEHKLEEFKTLTAGSITIGVGDTITRYFLLPYLETFHSLYPDIKLKMVNGTTSELCQLLKSGEVDVALCNFPIEDPKLKLIPCLDVQDVFVYGEKYHKILHEPIHLADLVKLPLIFLETSSNSRRYIEDYLKEQNVTIEPEFELGSHELLLDFAKINLGIACVTREFSKFYLDSGLLREVQLLEEIPKRQIGICYLNSVQLSPATMKFVQIVVNKQVDSYLQS